MTKISHLFARIDAVLRVLGSAGRAASAAEAGRMPTTPDLRRLGIDPAAFAAIVRP